MKYEIDLKEEHIANESVAKLSHAQQDPIAKASHGNRCSFNTSGMSIHSTRFILSPKRCHYQQTKSSQLDARRPIQ
jgi:hypothetical protein